MTKPREKTHAELTAEIDAFAAHSSPQCGQFLRDENGAFLRLIKME